MKLRYTPESLCDLQEIKRYIKSELHNPTAASRITKAILDGCAQLKQFPKMGVSIGAKTGYETDLRMLVVESYIATAEPIGSKAIAEQAGLTCSSATIRNECSKANSKHTDSSRAKIAQLQIKLTAIS